jgi:hypothetical protein
MLLDSLEAIDYERLADLIQYFADYAPFLLVALLPEDSEALAGYHDRITSDELSLEDRFTLVHRAFKF